jgi:hypothetical protein
MLTTQGQDPKVIDQRLREQIHRAQTTPGHSHMTPILDAVRTCGVASAIVPQNAGRFEFPWDRPTIVCIGDDTEQALGPTAFHLDSINVVLDKASAVAIVACWADPRIYKSAAPNAVLLRQHVLIIETRERYEADWLNLVEARRPRIACLVGLVKPEAMPV